VNVRVIAATNRNLQEAVRDGRFRADLLYRLNVFPIEVPPLRRRGSDVQLLAHAFLAAAARKLGKPVQGLSAASLERIAGYTWPGNVRELQNVVERAAILAPGPIVELDDALTGLEPPERGQPIDAAVGTLDDAQRARIIEALRSTGGVVDGARGAASILGLHPNTLRSRMKKLGISASSWRAS
jgi:transcriptional regulator with GAF, ATPase, and Fis domain